MTQDEAKPHIYDMIRNISVPLSDSDYSLMKVAEGFAALQFEQGYTQVVAVGVDNTGEVHTEIQVDQLSGKNNVCAEQFLVAKVRKLHRKLVVAAAWRHQIGIANPCAGCAEGYFHHYPDMHVIVWAADERRKIPIRGMVPIPFKKRPPSIKTNGSDW